jgi:hypothetical protein
VSTRIPIRPSKLPASERQTPTALDLWAELNRTLVSASSAREAFADLASALRTPTTGAVDRATKAADEALADAELEQVAQQISSMRSAKGDCGLTHDRHIWKVRDALLKANATVGRYRDCKATESLEYLGLVETARDQLQSVVDLSLDAIAGPEAEHAMKGRTLGAAVALADLFPELKGQPQRQANVAERLNARAGRLCVDTQRAVLYKKSDSTTAQVLTLLAPLLWALLGAIVVLLPHWLDFGFGSTGAFWTGWKTPIAAYALVLVGSVAHILVAAQKERQANSGAPLPIGSPLDWLETRWASIGLTFVWIVVAVFGVVMVANVPADLTREFSMLFLAAGYSLDSVAGMFLSRFDVLAKKGTATLTEKIAASDTAPTS